jgi:hypothetical protein
VTRCLNIINHLLRYTISILFQTNEIKLDRALSERTLLQTRVLKFRTTADLIHDEMTQTRKDQRSAPWERFSTFELKLQDLEAKLAIWEERVVDLEDRLIRLDEYCEELFALEGNDFHDNLIVGSEKEKYDCAIGTSLILTVLFAYDGVILGFPQLNFWMYLVLPHLILTLTAIGVIWKKGVLYSSPAAYLIGFLAILVLAMCHQQSFLQNQNDWRGILLNYKAKPRHESFANPNAQFLRRRLYHHRI